MDTERGLASTQTVSVRSKAAAGPTRADVRARTVCTRSHVCTRARALHTAASLRGVRARQRKRAHLKEWEC
eukprot:664191-Pleurochrysis_carterae.AAC.1